MSAHRGFTVWELLGVCAILFVVAAVLFPVFAHSHNRSGPSCASNEKMLGLAMMQYAQDNNNLLPSGSQHGGVGWGGQIYPYVKSTGVYQCPDDTTKAVPQRPVVSYGMNSNAALHPSLDNYACPAQTVLLFEVAGVAADVTQADEGKAQGATAFSAAGDGTDGSLAAGHAPGRQYATGNIGGRPARQPSQFGPARHPNPMGSSQDGANYLFADEHVKWLQPGQVSSGANAASAGAAQTGTLFGHAAGTKNAAYVATFSVK